MRQLAEHVAIVDELVEARAALIDAVQVATTPASSADLEPARAG